MPIQTPSGFSRPTFDEALAGRRAAYQRLFGDFPDDGILARLAEIDAEFVHALGSHIEYEIQQFMPMYATGKRLLEWGGFLIGPLKAATFATATWRVSGANGTELAALTRLVRADGVEYEVVTGGIVAGGTVDVPVRCITLGKVGNAAADSALALVNPVLGLDPSGVILAPGATGGAEAETEDQYRDRYLVRLREPPMGGNDTDYVTWALQVAGVTRAWVRRGPVGSGEVVVLFMVDGATASGIPVGDPAPNYTGDLKRVYETIEAKAPAPGVRYVKAPTAKDVPVTVKGLDPDTPEVRAAIAAELVDLFRRRAEPAKVMRKSWFAEAVSVATGEDGFDEIAAPPGSVVCAEDEIVVLGAISYEP